MVLAGGSRIGFMPDRFARRDPYFASVWIRNAAGRERAVVRFAGPGATVRPTPLRGEGVPLDQAWDAGGRTLAVSYGNDVDLFIYDIWVVDVRTREATRVTRGKVSRFPSLSPSGDRLAFVREVEHCGGPEPGYRAGGLHTMRSTGQDDAVLLPGGCPLFYTDPRWVSEDELVAIRMTRTAPGQYATDLVRVAVPSGAITELTTHGDVGFFNVSPPLGMLVYERRTVFPGFVLVDLGTGATTEFDEGFLPQLAGVHRRV